MPTKSSTLVLQIVDGIVSKGQYKTTYYNVKTLMLSKYTKLLPYRRMSHWTVKSIEKHAFSAVQVFFALVIECFGKTLRQQNDGTASKDLSLIVESKGCADNVSSIITTSSS